jgi:hypothetical protein
VQATEKTPQAERWAIARASESPDALPLAEDRIGIRPKGASGTRRSARPLEGGEVGMLIARTRKRRENANACFQDSGCLKFKSCNDALPLSFITQRWLERQR